GVDLPYGLSFAGDHTAAIGCTIRSGPDLIVYYSELSGINHRLVGNRMYATKDYATSEGHIYIPIGRSSNNVPLRNGGTFEFTDNMVDLGDYVGATQQYGVYVYNIAGTETEIDVVISGNTFRSTKTGTL